MNEAFDRYVNTFDVNDVNIKLKINHSYRVMELSKKYAELLGFSKEDIELATMIGLLHDFGRFEQFKQYHTYVDSKSIDHGALGVSLLFDEGYIKDFDVDEKDYDLVKFAIANHNKHHIEPCDDERYLMHARLIRDTDKIDILYLLGELGELDLKADDSEISEEFKEAFKKQVSIDATRRKTYNDSLCIKFGFIFDVYNDICLEETLKNLKAFYKQIDGNDKFKEIMDITEEYVKERMI